MEIDAPVRSLATAEELATVLDLVAEMVGDLITTGEHVAAVEVDRTEEIVDLIRATHEAGRQLGLTVDLDKRITTPRSTSSHRSNWR